MTEPDNGHFHSTLEVGQRLKFVRENAGFSQRELARRSEVTNGTLSNIEQGKVSPSIQSLEKILKAIPMSLPEFFSEDFSTSAPVYKKWQLVEVHKDDTEHSILPISGYRSGSAYLSKQTYNPGAVVNSEWMVTKGVISGLVFEGALHLTLDGIEYALEEGEGFSFSIQRAHVFHNRGSRKCVLVSVSLTDV